jgi:hypothetical protein
MGFSFWRPARPLRGGVNPPCSAIQVTLASGEQLSREALDAPSAAPSQRNPDNAPAEADIGVAAQLHIVFILFR